MSTTVTFPDYLAITELKSDYFRHLDSKRWDQLRELFSQSARFEGFAFDASGGREHFVEVVAEFLADVHSQHQGFMPALTRESATVIRGRWGMHDYLTWLPDTREYKGVRVPGLRGLRGWGFYEEQYALTSEGWRISFSRLTRTRIDLLVGDGALTHEFDVLSPDRDWLD